MGRSVRPSASSLTTKFVTMEFVFGASTVTPVLGLRGPSGRERGRERERDRERERFYGGQTLRISRLTGFGPREEKEAMIGAG